MRAHHAHRRDSSLRRLSVINRWLLAASVTVTAVLTDVVAHAFPSKSSTHKSTGSTKTRSKQDRRSAHPVKHTSSGAPKSLSPPAEAPHPAPEPSTPSESAQSEESARAATPEQSAPASEAAKQEPEPAPAPEPASAEEAPAPVVSGGS
jgi:hypothetical protein